MVEDGPFSRRLRRLRRDRAASHREDYLARLVGDELLARLAIVTRSFKEVLVLGCGHNELPDRLREQGMSVICADPGSVFARRCGGVQCDEDRLPFADCGFDLVLAAGTLDSVNDLPGALTLIRRTLRPDGLLLAAFTGAGSLPRLKDAMLTGELEVSGSVSPRIHPQIDIRAAGDLLTRTGFRLPVVDSHGITIRLRTMDQLVNDLRGAGWTNVLGGRREALTRAAVKRARTAFASRAESDGKVSEQIEILHLAGWAPSPDQPRPAQRGSGTRSLAAVLPPPQRSR